MKHLQSSTALTTLCILAITSKCTPTLNAAEVEQRAHQQQQQPHCSLGDDIFQIGERWNPVLDPFGVQVCVLCECTVRQRKNCYEARTACRRIANECPIIDSCPDGKEPITIAGQCCKSCHSSDSFTPSAYLHETSTGQQQTYSSPSSVPYAPSVTYNDQQPQQSLPELHNSNRTSSLAFRILYVNDRAKDYLSLVKNLEACATKEVDKHTSPAPIKAPKKNKSDLNGIDSRLAFKSLHDTHTTTFATVRLLGSSSSSNGLPAHVSGSIDINDHHQHPNDIQAASGGVAGQAHATIDLIHNTRTRGEFRGVGSWRESMDANAHISPYLREQQVSTSTPTSNSRLGLCSLGNDSFQVGDMWHPILPPHGVQQCVVCSCTVKQKLECYETRVTCRRLEKDCPQLHSCPDGRKPTLEAGQCCKTCRNLQNSTVRPALESEPLLDLPPRQQELIGHMKNLDLLIVKQNNSVIQEFITVSESMDLCTKRSVLSSTSSSRQENRLTSASMPKRRRKRKMNQLSSLRPLM